MIIRLFQAMRSHENKRDQGSSHSLAYGLFGFFLPVLFVLFIARVFERLFFKVPAEVLFPAMFVACLASVLLLNKYDDGK